MPDACSERQELLQAVFTPQERNILSRQYRAPVTQETGRASSERALLDRGDAGITYSPPVAVGLTHEGTHEGSRFAPLESVAENGYSS